MGTKKNPGEFDCYRVAEPDEPMFILLGRDPLAPVLVHMWALLRRLFRGRSRKVDEALLCARLMRTWRHAPRPRPRHPFQNLGCIGCGAEGAVYSFADDHPASIDVGPFCSQCFEGIQELVIKWQKLEGLEPIASPPSRQEPPLNRIIREGDPGPRP